MVVRLRPARRSRAFSAPNDRDFQGSPTLSCQNERALRTPSFGSPGRSFASFSEITTVTGLLNVYSSSDDGICRWTRICPTRRERLRDSAHLTGVSVGDRIQCVGRWEGWRRINRATDLTCHVEASRLQHVEASRLRHDQESRFRYNQESRFEPGRPQCVRCLPRYYPSTSAVNSGVGR